MSYPCWVDIEDMTLLNQVIFDTQTLQSGGMLNVEAEQIASAQDAIAAATEILFRLTGGTIHGPGNAVDEYTFTSDASCNLGPVNYVRGYGLRRLSTTFKPIRDVVKLERTSLLSGDTIDLSNPMPLVKTGNSLQALRPLVSGNPERFRLTYRFGSTLTRGARSALIYYARQLYLGGPYGDPETCELPTRTTSITREGLSMSLLDPATLLDKGLTGLIRVDEWLASYANRKTTRPSAVYGYDAPPPVNVAVWCNSTVPVAHVTLESLR